LFYRSWRGRPSEPAWAPFADWLRWTGV